MSHHTPPSARFDYFRASVSASAEELIAAYSAALGLEPRSTKALYGYPSAVGLYKGDDPDLIIFFGEGQPLVQASGYHAQEVWQVTNRAFPTYRASRLDVAVDFHDEDWWDPTHSLMRELSHRRRAKHSIMGDWETPGSPDGRTVYSGSRTSSAFRRLYEFRKHHGYGPAVRFELEVKPKHSIRDYYAGMGPLSILSTDSYSVELLAKLGFDIDRLTITPLVRPEGELERWWSHFIHQHGPKVMTYIARALGGDITALGPAVVEAIEARESERQRKTPPPIHEAR